MVNCLKITRGETVQDIIRVHVRPLILSVVGTRTLRISGTSWESLLKLSVEEITLRELPCLVTTEETTRGLGIVSKHVSITYQF